MAWLDVMGALPQGVMPKKDLNLNEELRIYQMIKVPTRPFGHEVWVKAERMKLQIQAAAVSFLCRVAGFNL